MNQLVNADQKWPFGQTGVTVARGGWKTITDTSLAVDSNDLPVFVRELCERVAPLIATETQAHAPSDAPTETASDTPRGPDRVEPEAQSDVEQLRATLLQALLAEDSASVAAACAGLRSADAVFPVLFDTVLNPVMQLLGEMWEDDDANFVEVTVATSRMHSMLHDLTNASAYQAARPQDRDPILLARMDGEDHTLGLIAVAACFSRAGWDVQGGAEIETGSSLWEAIKARRYSVLGISVGDVARIEEVKQAISLARQASCNSDLVIGVGGPPISAQPDLFCDVGADFVAPTAILAVDYANRLAQSHA